ncbi:MAG TPA: SDR family NAD(P)-dependent oxidoreductase [Solirubrobacteraceae bacterium]|nr:SDR family NAD(P)-dependent oxidoreductase [Solirubrobacteraceae bacterium]
MTAAPHRRLDGKVALITGTAGGMGRAAARLFAAEGARVAGCDVQVEGAAETERLVRGDGGEMTSTAPVDLADWRQASAWVESAVATYGGIDVLYNNAGTPRVGPFDDVTPDDWHFTIRNELDLVFMVTKAAWPHLIARGGGVVINTASVSADRGVASFVQQAAHGAAKGGIRSFTRHVAASGARHGIRANSISPALIVTPQIAEFLEDPGHPMHEIRRNHPLRRLGEPEDVAKVALFLASDEAAYLNAIDIRVDGGQTIFD